MNDYSSILTFSVTALAICSIIIGASYLFSVKNPDAEKVSVYECGFDPFGDSRQKFEVRFFLVGILFIIFDLEVSFLFPWSVALNGIIGDVGTTGYWSMIVFLGILTIGLVYEWLKGGLEWE